MPRVQIGRLAVIIPQGGHRVRPDAEETDLSADLLTPLPVGKGREWEARVRLGGFRRGLGFGYGASTTWRRVADGSNTTILAERPVVVEVVDGL